MPETTRRSSREHSQRVAASNASRRRRRRRVIGWSITGAVVAALAVVAVVGWNFSQKVLSVKDDLEAAQQAVTGARAGGDIAASLVVVGEKAASAAKTADDPMWHLLEGAPVVGDNLRAVRLVAEALDDVSNDVAMPLLAVQNDGQGSVLSRALPIVEQGSEIVTNARTGLTQLAESSDLIDQVRAAVVQVDDVLAEAEPAFQFVPLLLGADGEKRYLLVFQNNAEALPLGGSAASQTLVSASNGDVRIAGQASSGQFANGTAVDAPVDPSAIALYSRYLVDHVNTSVTRPDFPTAATILRAFWQRDVDPGAVDAVISVDPLALSRLLAVTGPVRVGDIEVNSENAVKVLLSDSYIWWNPFDGEEEAAASDAFFSAVAQQVFDRIAAGSFDIKKMISAVGDSISAGSIMAWSDEPRLAELIADQRVAGALPTTNEDTTTVGVFFRDSSAAKIDYYMDSAVTLASQCADGNYTVSIDAQLHLNIDQDAADELPSYVRGTKPSARDFQTQIILYGPPGTSVGEVTVGDERATVINAGTDDLGRPVTIVQTSLDPGESSSMRATFTGTGDFGPLEARLTPMIRPTALTVNDGCR